MEKIVIRIRDKSKAKALTELLRLLDFVDSVDTSEIEETQVGEEADFYALAGLWEGRDVTQASLREKAWPYRS